MDFFDDLKKSLVDALATPPADDDKGGNDDASSGDDGATPEALTELTKSVETLSKQVGAIAKVLDPGLQKDTEGDEVVWEREPGELIKAIGAIQARVDTHHEVLEKVTDFTSALNKQFAKSKQPDGEDGTGDGEPSDPQKDFAKAQRELDVAIGAAARNGSSVTLV